MDSHFFHFRRDDVYYICSCIKHIVDEPFEYLRFYDDIFGEDRIAYYSCNYSKVSSGLELFIRECIDRIYSELTEKVTIEQYENACSSNYAPMLTIEKLFVRYDIKYAPYIHFFKDQQMESSEYLSEVSEQFFALTEYMAKEVLHILFFDRVFLQKLYSLMADNLQLCVEQYKKSDGTYEFPEDIKKYFQKNGKIQRKSPPKWLKRAVFMREHGCCAICQCDLSGVFRNLRNENFDHIVPLNLYGGNDVGNLQLLCHVCNNKKSGASKQTTDIQMALW